MLFLLCLIRWRQPARIELICMRSIQAENPHLRNLFVNYAKLKARKINLCRYFKVFAERNGVNRMRIYFYSFCRRKRTRKVRKLFDCTKSFQHVIRKNHDDNSIRSEQSHRKSFDFALPLSFSFLLLAQSLVVNRWFLNETEAKANRMKLNPIVEWIFRANTKADGGGAKSVMRCG